MPPTVVAPGAPWTIAAARSRGPSLRASASKRAELLLRQADDQLAVEDADRGRHRAALPHRALGRKSDVDPFAGREAVRDERRLERNHAAAVAQSLGNFDRDPGHGIDPSFAQQRAAAASPELGPADQEARSERVAGAGRVDDGRLGGGIVAAVDRQAAGAALDHPAGLEVADGAPLALGGEGEIRCKLAYAHTERSSTSVQVDTSNETWAPCRAGQHRCPCGRAGQRFAEQRVTGDVQHVGIEPCGFELFRLELDGRTAVGSHRPVAGRRKRHDDPGPAASRAATSTPRSASSCATSAPAVSAPSLPT